MVIHGRVLEASIYKLTQLSLWTGKDHFYTTNPNEVGTTTPGHVGRAGYKSEGIAGYCFPEKDTIPGTVPLYRYWKASVMDHFYTTNPNEIGTTTWGQTGNHGYVSQGIICYIVHV